MRRDPGLPLLAAVLVAAFAVMAYLGRGSIFFYDEWVFWIEGPSLAPSHLFEQYNGQPSLIPRLYWAFVAGLFGEGDYLPFRLVWYVMQLSLLAGVYALLRPRVGWAPGIAVIVPLAVLGVGAADLAMLMPITGLYFVWPLVCFVWAIVALERGTRGGDVVACVLLVLSAFTSSSGLAPLVGAAAYLLWSRPQWRRLWVPLVPVGLFALWYLLERPEQTGDFTRADISRIPLYVLEGAGHGAGVFTGLGHTWGQLLAVAVAALFAVKLVRGDALPRTAIGVAAAGVAYWALLSLGRGPELRPSEARYLFPNAVYVVVATLLLAAGTAHRWPPRRIVPVAFVLAGAFALPNLEAYVEHARSTRSHSATVRAQLTAVELAAGQGKMRQIDYRPLMAGRGDPLEVMVYADQLHHHERVGYTEREVEALPDGQRQWIDRTSLEALEVVPMPVDRAEPAGPAPALGSPTDGGAGEVRTSGACHTMQPAAGAPTGALVVAADRPFTVQALDKATADVRLRRYVSRDPTWLAPFTSAGAGKPLRIAIPKDKSPRAWFAHIASTGRLRVCGTR